MDRAFFEENRNHLLQALPVQDEWVLVLFSGFPRRRSADEDYPFLGNRNFAYLTGFEKDNLIYVAWGKGNERHEMLYLPPVDDIRERWMGRMIHPEQVEPRCGIAEKADRESFETDFHRLVSNMAGPTVFVDMDPAGDGRPAEPGEAFAGDVRRRYPWCRIQNCHRTLQRLRTIKQPQELEELRQSIAVTDRAIRAMLKACHPGMHEYQLRSVFEKELADCGWREPSFETIIGAGRNALIMHYPEQDCIIRDGDMILIDLGAQAGFVGADISRVFPANGKFTERQRLLHDSSLSTITYLCEHLKPGMRMTDIDRIGAENLLPKLRAMGLLENAEELPKYCWHNISHHLGFDTHDDNDYTMPIAAGMVFTMEVGIYVPQWGEGVRIEDNILMTDHGCENLSDCIPRTVEEIESAMADKE